MAQDHSKNTLYATANGFVLVVGGTFDEAKLGSDGDVYVFRNFAELGKFWDEYLRTHPVQKVNPA